MRFIISLLVTGLVVTIAAMIVPGVYVAGFFWAVVTGAVIGVVNAIVGGILRLFTFPLNWLTFGLVSFIITVLMVMLSDNIMGSKFEINGFWNALYFALAVSIIEIIIDKIFSREK